MGPAVLGFLAVVCGIACFVNGNRKPALTLVFAVFGLIFALAYFMSRQ